MIYPVKKKKNSRLAWIGYVLQSLPMSHKHISFTFYKHYENNTELLQAEIADMLSRLESLQRQETAVRQRLSDLQLESLTSKNSSKESLKKKSSLRINQTPSVLQAGVIVQENGFI